MRTWSEKFTDAVMPADVSVWAAAAEEEPSLWQYAASLDGHAVLGERGLEFASAVREVYGFAPNVLSLLTPQGLRLLLFAEYRAQCWAEGWEPNETSPYVRAIVAEIRARVDD